MSARATYVCLSTTCMGTAATEQGSTLLHEFAHVAYSLVYILVHVVCMHSQTIHYVSACTYSDIMLQVYVQQLNIKTTSIQVMWAQAHPCRLPILDTPLIAIVSMNYIR